MGKDTEFKTSDPAFTPSTPLSERLSGTDYNNYLLKNWKDFNIGRIMHYSVQKKVCENQDYSPTYDEKAGGFKDKFIEAVYQQTDGLLLDFVDKARRVADATAAAIEEYKPLSAEETSVTLSEVYSGIGTGQIAVAERISVIKGKVQLEDSEIVESSSNRDAQLATRAYAQKQQDFVPSPDRRPLPEQAKEHVLAKLAAYHVTGMLGIPHHAQTSPEAVGVVNQTESARRMFTYKARADMIRFVHETADAEAAEVIGAAGELIKGTIFGRRALLDTTKYTVAQLDLIDSFFILLSSGRVRAEMIEIKTDSDAVPLCPTDPGKKWIESEFDPLNPRDAAHLEDICHTTLAFWQLLRKMVADPEQRRRILENVTALGIQIHLGQGSTFEEIVANESEVVEVKTAKPAVMKRSLMRKHRTTIRTVDEELFPVETASNEARKSA